MSQLRGHFNVLYALIIRDLMTRFGRQHLGFVWTILEPMILCTGVMVVWSFIHEPLIHGFPVVELVFTGYMPLTLWRHLTNPMAHLLRRNSGMLYHRPVSHVHIILARSILEFLSTSMAALVIYFILTASGLMDPIVRPDLVLAGWLYTGWYFGGMGLLIGTLTEYFEVAEKFIQPFNYLMLPLSGNFFMVDWLPDSVQHIALLNPSVNCFEMIRAGFGGAALNTHYNVGYLTAAAAIMSIFGAIAVYHVRDSIQVA
jgi:capsular polysaccharide transport system permease protein